MPHVQFRVTAADRSIDAGVHLPDQPLRPVELLPVLLSFTDAVVSMSETRAAENGETISCRAGCGACCRQLVPVSEPEALHLAGLVAGMPPDRRARVEERFRDACDRAAAVLGPLHASEGEAAMAEMGQAAEAYFTLGLACPFLEEESCSIHPDRPSICREYLVTSHPDHCARMDKMEVKRVPVPVTVSSTLIYFDGGATAAEPRVMPLIESLDWAARRHGDSRPGDREVPAPEMFRNFLKLFAGEHAIR